MSRLACGLSRCAALRAVHSGNKGLRSGHSHVFAMAHLPILRYPDPRLHIIAKPVREVDERIRRLVDDMLDTMHAAEGVGLAATQVDVHERVIVIDTSETRDDPRVLINPELLWLSD